MHSDFEDTSQSYKLYEDACANVADTWIALKQCGLCYLAYSACRFSNVQASLLCWWKLRSGAHLPAFPTDCAFATLSVPSPQSHSSARLQTIMYLHLWLPISGQVESQEQVRQEIHESDLGSPPTPAGTGRSSRHLPGRPFGREKPSLYGRGYPPRG